MGRPNWLACMTCVGLLHAGGGPPSVVSTGPPGSASGVQRSGQSQGSLTADAMLEGAKKELDMQRCVK